MAQIMMFNPSNLHQQLVDSNRSSDIDRLVDLGWMKNPPLIHVHHDGYNDDKMVLPQDVPTWENKGYFANPTWVYHPQEGAKMVSDKEAKKLCSQGYYNSPAQFPGNAEGTIRGNNTLKLGAA